MGYWRKTKTEHAGAKNGDKRGTRAEVKNDSRHIRRQNDKREAADGGDSDGD